MASPKAAEPVEVVVERIEDGRGGVFVLEIHPKRVEIRHHSTTRREWVGQAGGEFARERARIWVAALIDSGTPLGYRKGLERARAPRPPAMVAEVSELLDARMPAMVAEASELLDVRMAWNPLDGELAVEAGAIAG